MSPIANVSEPMTDAVLDQLSIDLASEAVTVHGGKVITPSTA